MVVVWWSLGAMAADVEGTASGFVELRNVWSLGVDGKPWLLVERFRPTFEAELSKRVHLEATVELGLQQGRLLQDEFDRTLLASRLNQPVSVGDPATPLTLAGCEVVGEDAANGLFHVDGIDDYAAVDRLFADVYLDDADLRFGRQAVQWGSALLVHPADPFPEVLFLEPWRPRRGVNAARLNLQLGDVSAVTLLGGVDDALREARLAGRITANVLETDVSLIGAYRADRPSRAELEVPPVPTRKFPGLGADRQVPAAPLPGSGIVGVDIKGTLELGFWLEGSWHFQPQPSDGTGQDDFAEVAVGLDYSFDILDQFVFGAQYYYNGAGSPEPDGLALAGRFSGALEPPLCVGAAADVFGASTAGGDPFASPFVGRDYGMVYTAIAVNDRWSGNAALVQNLDDGSGIGVPTVSYRPAGWAEFSLSAQLPYALWGDGGEFRPSAADTTAELEFLPDTFVELDLAGLVPDATVIVWTRASF